jgi:hypothetical protein
MDRTLQDTSTVAGVEFRKARLSDVPALRALIQLSTRALSGDGYRSDGARDYPLPDDASISFVPMRKTLT